MTNQLRTLRPHQVEAMDGIKASIMAGQIRPILAAPTGFGKCLGLGTPVMRFDGHVVPVETVRTGDLLMGPDSMPRRVLGTSRGRSPMFRIVPTKGDPWVCNDVHVLTLVETESGRVIDIPLDEYLAKSKWFKHIHKQFAPAEGVDFDGSVDPDIDAYFLGVWLGDGTKSLGVVAVTKPDAAIVDACMAVAERHGLRVTTDGPQHGKCPTHRLARARVPGEALQPNDLLRKLKELFGDRGFPHSIKTASRLFRQEFLAGVIDTDGHVQVGCVDIVQRNRSHADGIAFVARSLGLRVVEGDKFVNGTTYRRLNISGSFDGIVTRIPRKRIPARQQIKVATRTGFKVEPIGLGEYAGFTLDGDGRFLLGDFTVTHNTEVAAHLIADARERNKRIAFCVPTIGLVDQTFERFIANGFAPDEMGVIQADHPWRRPHAPVQIATAQTLGRRDRPLVDEVIIDEAHTLFDAYKSWMTDPEWSHVPFIGMTATPGTKGLGKYFTNLVRPITLSELIAQQFLVPMRVFAPSKPDLEGVSISQGDYHQGELAERMNKPHLVADVVQTWLARGERRPTLCFATGKLHAKALYEQFAMEGVPAAYVDADTPREERDRIGRAMAAREILVAVNIGTLTTGIDWDVRCIILARPTKSQMLFVQMIGRGLRTADAKADCIVLDHSDTHERLGMVTDISFELCDGRPKPKADPKKREDKTLLPKCCKACSALMPAHELKCLACGEPLHLPPVFTADGELTLYGQSNVADGLVRQLREMGITMRAAADGRLMVSAPNNFVPDEFQEQIRAHRDDLYRLHAPKRPKGDSVRGDLQQQPKQVIFSMLLTYADSHGYSEGWAAHKYKEIYDVWPRGLAKHGELPPSPVLMSWIRAQQIRWAKSAKNVGGNHAAV